MSVLGLTKLAWDLEHETGLLERYRRDPDPVLDAYQLTEAERAAVRALDPHPLLAVGLNPVVLRNLFVILGVAHGEIYAPRPDRPDPRVLRGPQATTPRRRSPVSSKEPASRSGRARRRSQ